MLGRAHTYDDAAFGLVLRRLRKAAGLSQEELGFATDFQRNYISLLELGKHQPTLPALFRISYALNKSTSDLIAEVEKQLQQNLKAD